MNKTYQWSQKLSAEDYVYGLQKISPRINAIQLKLLVSQYHAPNRTVYATQLAEIAAIQGGYPVVNRQYGGLGHLFCDETGHQPDIRDNGKPRWWSVWSLGHWTRQGFIWEMLPSVAEALEILGWVNGPSKTGRSLTSIIEDFEEAVNKASSDSSTTRKKRLKDAPKSPAKSEVIVSIFDRNPDVVAEVLSQAKGYCWQCKQPAPFRRKSDGTPYLEVHHVKPLSEGGEDTVKNAVALCPNCHRKAHYG